ncbi:hypothetical protein BDQ17DRAFT_1328706 [Cyathus striatus]|nr:hypothetical protein BDQ17DRAFT_1328706 [Cyathus striatus]
MPEGMYVCNSAKGPYPILMMCNGYSYVPLITAALKDCSLAELHFFHKYYSLTELDMLGGMLAWAGHFVISYCHLAWKGLSQPSKSPIMLSGCQAGSKIDIFGPNGKVVDDFSAIHSLPEMDSDKKEVATSKDYMNIHTAITQAHTTAKEMASMNSEVWALLFQEAGFMSPLLLSLQTACVSLDNKLIPGDFVFVFSDNAVMIGKAIMIYARTGGTNEWHADQIETTNIAAKSYTGVQIF